MINRHLHAKAPTKGLASALQACRCCVDEVEVGGEVHQTPSRNGAGSYSESTPARAS
jgi:hypothetical protein